MPKKTASVRGGVQRNKPKVQKNIELVRPAKASDELAVESGDDSDVAEAASTAVATSLDTMVAPGARGSGTTRRRSTSAPKVHESSAVLVTPDVKKEELEAEVREEAVSARASAVAVPKSASARLAARRQSGQKNQRTAVALISAEHYSYVRKDLIFIAVLAIIMFAAIIVLHFVPGIGS